MAGRKGEGSTNLTLEEKIGQMIWCPIRGSHSWFEGSDFAGPRRLLEKGLIGGVVLRAGDLYETATLINQLQQKSTLPLAVAADAENGLGRLLNEGTCFPSNMAFGATRSGEYSYLAGKIIAQEAGTLGINIIFGPTCSRSGSGLPEGIPPVRSFGERLHLVTRLAIAFVKGVHDGGGLAVPRHFPGTAAVHSGEISGSRWLYYMRKLLVDTELSIYEMLFQAHLTAAMIDWREMPDLLTGKTMLTFTNRHLLEDFLREVMGFEGVAISPDLSVPGRPRLLEDETLIQAINAGIDILAGVPDPERVMKLVQEAVVRERIPISRIDSAADRILSFKQRLKKKNGNTIRPEDIDRRVASQAHLEVSERVAEDSITLLRDRKKILPLDPASHRTLLNISVIARSGIYIDRPLEEALRKNFDRVINRRIDGNVLASTLEEVWGDSELANVILCSMFTNLPPEFTPHGFTTTQIEFIQRLIGRDKPLIMASFGDPRTIRLFPDVDC
ncbi:MAG: glycoside hydrolase family 3 N-terminal domain-containing protein, partial [Candidatus Glassbacteria bacterium]